MSYKKISVILFCGIALSSILFFSKVDGEFEIIKNACIGKVLGAKESDEFSFVIGTEKSRIEKNKLIIIIDFKKIEFDSYWIEIVDTKSGKKLLKNRKNYKPNQYRGGIIPEEIELHTSSEGSKVNVKVIQGIRVQSIGDQNGTKLMKTLASLDLILP